MSGSPRRVVPVDLGCCPPGAPRCVLCAPAPTLVLPEPGLRTSFLGGPPPAAPLLDALEGAAFTCRVRPDLLTRADLARLVEAGCVGIELDACTLDDHALRRCGRPYTGRRIEEVLAGIRAAGIEAGVVLCPGLPGTDADTLLADADRLAGRIDTARLHPVLVRAGSTLRRWYTEGLYRPLSLEAAVEICGALLERLEAGGARVLRIGLQPGEAEGEVVAGPVHSSLRELVESDRALAHLRTRLTGVLPGAWITVSCARADETRTRGPGNRNLRVLRRELGLAGLRVVVDEAGVRGTWRVREESW